MAKGRVVFYEAPPPRTQAPPRSVYTARARRRRRRRGASGLLFALAALVLAAAVGYVIWYTRPAGGENLPDPDREQVEEGVEPEDAALTAGTVSASDGRIVVAIDPGHGGVNPGIGAEDFGSEANGLQESEITLATARALYDLLASDERFAPMLTADGTEYLKPSERGAAAKAAGAQLFLSIHLNYDTGGATSGFECYAAPPYLSTNAESVRFGELLAASFSQMGLRLRGTTGVRYLYYDANGNKQIYESTDTTIRWDPTFTVLSSCGCPAVLCEEGFISNAGDMALLAGDDGCQAAAQCYYDCICTYFNLT